MHRLDVETSGVLLCAKSYMGALCIRMKWCSHDMTKEYVCLVHGWIDPSVKQVFKRIRTSKEKANSSRCTISHCSLVSERGKPAHTEVATLAHLFRVQIRMSKPLEETSKEHCSLVAIQLHTGLTHQI